MSFAITHIMTGGVTAILTALEHVFKAKGFSMEGAKKQSLGELRVEKVLAHATAHQS